VSQRNRIAVQRGKILHFIFASFIIFYSCTKKQSLDPRIWYNHTKSVILKNSMVRPDSIVGKTLNNSSWVLTFSSRGKTYRELRNNSLSRVHADTYYGKNHDFELRREICQNGTISFEGIFYKKLAYGLSTWYENCDSSKIKEQGVRYKSGAIGIWKIRNDNGRLVEEDHNNSDKLDSMPLIKTEY
jgi:hypothetical protein